MAKNIVRVSKSLPVSKSPLRVGNVVLIRTVTYATCGRVVELTDTDIVLEDAAWIGDTGRFNSAITTGTFGEVEPITTGPVLVSRGSVVDVFSTPAVLPLAVK